MDKSEGVLNFLMQYKEENDGNSPSIREIMRECGLSSTSVVDAALKKLERQGRITRRSRRARSITVIEE